MNHLKVLSAIFIGTLVYVVVSFIGGDNGLISYKKLELQKREISRQTEKIEKIHNELDLEHTALLKDRDLIASYARKLDYVVADEKLVKINGLKPAQTTLYDTGTVLRHKDYKCLPEDFCKIFGFSFFILSLILFLLIDLSKGNITVSRKKNDYVKGIPIYDVQQI